VCDPRQERGDPGLRGGSPRGAPPRLRRGIALGLVAACVLVYGQVATHDFVELDDWTVIVYNPLVLAGVTPESVVRAIREPAEANWVPLTWISLQLGYELHGLAPAGFLLVNVALHALASALLFLALLRLTGATWPSAFVAAVFALHPLHVESVAWAASRKDVLSGVFFMLCLLAWARYAERPSPSRYAAAALALAAGLLSKPTLVTTPFVLWLLDVWPLGRLRGASGARESLRRASLLLLEKLPLLLLCAATGAIAYAVQSRVGTTRAGEQLGLALRAMNALDAYRIYLAQSVWPSGLCPFYPHPLDRLTPARTAAAAALLGVVSLLAAAQLRRRPCLGVGWLWFLGMLVPTIGLVQVGGQAHADRYMYLPIIGLALALACLVAETVATRPALRAPVAIAAGLALTALSVATVRQVDHWRDPIALHTRTVAVSGRSAIAHHRLANALRRADRLEEAEREFRNALAISPRAAALQLGLADVLARRGRLEEAIPHYRLGVAAAPTDALAHANLGVALARAGRLGEARVEVARAIALQGPEGAGGRALAALRALAARRADDGDPARAARLRALADDLEREVAAGAEPPR
jgi:tetratricopeptide (TPR) repeat protein